MTEGPAAPAPAGAARIRRWEISLPIVVISWRLSWYPLHEAWRDWVLLVALYWVFCIRAEGSRSWKPVTAVLMLGLALVYLARQLPYSFETFRFGFFG
jgi:hypothetical protein